MPKERKYISDYDHMMELWSNKNTLNPSFVGAKSNKKTLWECSSKHTWEATPSKINIGRGCPYCSGRRVLIGYNDLVTTHPDILKYWNYEKNLVKPSEIRYGTKTNLWWKCELGHSWEKFPLNLINGERCPYCSNHRVLKGFNDLATTHPEALKIWDYKKNRSIVDPTTITFGSGKRAWWKCELGHSWESVVAKILSTKRSCPYCSFPPKKILTGFNDLVSKSPEVLEFWDYSKNTVSPDTIAPSSSLKVWWKCKKGHEWKHYVYKISLGERCPYCAGKKVLIKFNDLKTKCPSINEIWHDSNKLLPQEYVYGSEKPVTIYCRIDREISFSTSPIKISASYPFCVCSDCTRGRSKFEKEVHKFIESKTGYPVYNNNRKLISPYELDIVIPELKVAFECNGDYWHSNKVINEIKNISAYEHHALKVKQCKDKGYDLYFIWENDWRKKRSIIELAIIELINNGTPNDSLIKLESEIYF